jgi:hypothetical protein
MATLFHNKQVFWNGTMKKITIFLLTLSISTFSCAEKPTNDVTSNISVAKKLRKPDNPTTKKREKKSTNVDNAVIQDGNEDGSIIVQGSGTITYKDREGNIQTYTRPPNSTTIINKEGVQGKDRGQISTGRIKKLNIHQNRYSCNDWIEALQSKSTKLIYGIEIYINGYYDSIGITQPDNLEERITDECKIDPSRKLVNTIKDISDLDKSKASTNEKEPNDKVTTHNIDMNSNGQNTETNTNTSSCDPKGKGSTCIKGKGQTVIINQ